MPQDEREATRRANAALPNELPEVDGSTFHCAGSTPSWATALLWISGVGGQATIFLGRLGGPGVVIIGLVAAYAIFVATLVIIAVLSTRLPDRRRVVSRVLRTTVAWWPSLGEALRPEAERQPDDTDSS